MTATWGARARCTFCRPQDHKEGLPPVPRSIRPLIALCASALLLVPAAAEAQTATPTEIDGSPLNIWAADDGGIQTNVDGYTSSEWFPYVTSDPTTGDPVPNPLGNAGFGLLVDPENPNGGVQRFGKFVTGGLPTPDAPGTTLTPGNPATLSTTWTLNDQSSGSP